MFTGGSTYIEANTPLLNRTETDNIFTRNAAYLVKLAIEANDNNDYFPIWGTC